jgi:hypothetical protein
VEDLTVKLHGCGRLRGVQPTIVAIAAALSLLPMARPACAETITMTYLGLEVSTPGPAGGSGGVFAFQGPTNLAGGTLGLFPGLTPLPGTNFNTFCLDAYHSLQHTAQDTVVYATPGALGTANDWSSISNIHNDATAVNILELFGTYFTGLSTPSQYASFQDAIWILEGATINDTLANYWVTHLGTTEATNVVIFDTGLSKDGQPLGQNQISVINPVHVPAPPGALLAVIGCIGLVGYRFRSRRVLAR